ncbi:ABC transporter permease [Actinomyces sp. B33]|uniref:ABC transporter permease n=1 Tax=Actinomyces sp. B33 TaxID=2942131 RepID=UPI00233FFFD9|nr:ABC transporter permease subunit [Actinomyces sp. B33]MDC4232378.1 ABC transporter permease [Actinomyces sp. B33]
MNAPTAPRTDQHPQETPMTTDSPFAWSTARRRTIAGRQTPWRAVRAEWIKLRSLRSTWVTSLATVAITVAFGAGMTIALASFDGGSAEAPHMIAAGSIFGQLVVAVLGALIVTGEYSSGQIRSTLAATPKRTRVLLGKSLVGAAWAFLLGAASILIAWGISFPFLGEHAIGLTDPEYLGYVWGTALSYAGISLMSSALGFLLRSTAGAVTAIAVLLFVLTIPLSVAAVKWDWATKIAQVLPGNVASAVADPFSLAHTWADADPAQFLTHAQAVWIFAAWAIIPLVVAWAVFSRRDAA